MNVRNFIKLLIILIIITTPAFCQVSEVVSGGGSSEWTASGSTQIYTEKSVGIGTSTPDPAYKCYIDGDSRITGSLLVASDTTEMGKITLGTRTGSSQDYCVLEETDPWGLWKLTGYNGIGLKTANSSIGFVGTGLQYITFPDDCYMAGGGNVDDDIVYGFGWSVNGKIGIAHPAYGEMSLWTSDAETMRLTDNQNVLIGTTVDDGVNKLQVNGSAYISDTLKLEPIAEPSNPTEGMIYQSSADHHLYVYDGTAWKQLDN